MSKMKFKPKHFSPKEFYCKCGKCGLGYDSMEEGILKLIDKIREEFGGPIYITSSIRCRDYNKAVGGATKSYHMFGMACDLSPINTTEEKYKKLESITNKLNPKGGVGYYPQYGFVHCDIRGKRGRWSG